MKELHNHIFSNTTCISKETMLKYINHQLSDRELHDVEKHMLDCEFCSDALEGMKYAQNSSVLFAIDNQIDQRVRTGRAGASVMKNLMVAASILIIVFGAYFTFNYFDETANNQANLAINDNQNKEESGDGKLGNTEKHGNVQSEGVNSSITEPEMVTEKTQEQKEKKYTALAEQTPPPSPIVEEIVLQDEETEEDNLSDDVTVTGYFSESENEVALKDTRNNVAGDAVISESSNQPTTTDLNFGFASSIDDEELNAVKKEAKKDDRKRAESTRKGNKNKFKSKSTAPSFDQSDNFADKLKEKAELANNRNNDQTITLSNYKVVDYTEEYQKEYDLKQVVETKSVSADFETQQEAAEAERELDEITVEITYKATLEKAMVYYKAKKYVLAIEQFDVILNEHPNEVNGLFYGGLSNYHLQRYVKASNKFDKVLTNPKTQFHQEAEWYKALTLIELNKITEAKKLLQKIIAGSGFYKTKAEEQLKDL